MTNDKSQNLPKTERTPGNWKIDDADDLPLAIIEDTEDGLGIIEFCERTPQNIANAAFIVKACNLHDELVDALTWLVRCADPNDDDEGFNNWKIQDIEHAVNRAKDLIAKAQEV
jgi:hypothetical protein